MASQPPPDPNAPPQSIVLGGFDGIRNTVAAERLGPRDLEKAVNIDLDDSGQPRRRRGYVLEIPGNWHSVRGPLAGKAYGVKDGQLGIIRPQPAFAPLGITIGNTPCCFTEVNEDVYFSSSSMSGVISQSETVSPWGHTDGQGFWSSPVYAPTDTLGQVGGDLLGDPPKASTIEYFAGRIYLAVDKTLWKTELWRYHYIDLTGGFYQFEYPITMVRAVDDGLYVGTTGGLYFLQSERILMREFKSLKLDPVIDAAVLPGSDVRVPVNLIHPNAQSQPMATGFAVAFMTSTGIMAGFNSGETFNLTQGHVELPSGVSAAGLFRRDQGANTYVAVVDSAGAPSAHARIGDYIEAEVIRAADRQGG